VVIGSDDGQRGYHIHAEDIKKISTTGLRRKIDGQLWEIGAVKQEMRELVSSTWPMVFTMVMFYLANVITISFVGQLGALDLAAVGLGVSAHRFGNWVHLARKSYLP
jgi:Na+-driven multidrug efflux pump